ncbi:hypothetical protein [Pseudomonas fluorescens]|uniref:hypothetical protein n=1 Tax=Pseudomonas fluorescens TaxID=294 RepID=UPI0011CD60A5|nr:hypothetical protein [Pseudomonas fluorescens]
MAVLEWVGLGGGEFIRIEGGGLADAFSSKMPGPALCHAISPRSDIAFLHLMAFRNELGLTAPVSL